jgi:hypothetical protein
LGGDWQRLRQQRQLAAESVRRREHLRRTDGERHQSKRRQ